MKSIKEIFRKKKDTESNILHNPQPIPDNMWVCPRCGTKNNINAQFCKDCGVYR